MKPKKVNIKLIYIEMLKSAAAQVSRGNFETRIDIASHDEFQELADDFNAMVLALSRKTARLTKLYELGITRRKNSAEIATDILSIVVTVMDVGMATVKRVGEDSITIVAFNSGDHIRHEDIFPLKGTPSEHIKKEKRACLYFNALEQFPGDLFIQKNNITSYLGVPIISGPGRVVGVIDVLDTKKILFSEEDIELLFTLSRRMAFEWEQEAHINEIKYYSMELERKVEERTLEIQAVNKDLVLANQVKSEFLAGMSHELRTPLTAIIGFSEVLSDQNFGPLNAKQEEYLRDILESGKHLLALINDILDISKFESGKIELELSDANVMELLENSLIMIKEKAYKHGIALELIAPEEMFNLEIRADERKLKQILFNLLSNAAKFTPDGGSIRIEADIISETGNRLSALEGEERQTAIRNPKSQIEISVADSGIGILEEDQEKIFEEFYQVRGGTLDKTAGTGLGLPLCKSMVEMHGGKIWVSSEGEGKGSRFSFVLPMAAGHPEEARIELENLGRTV